MSVFVNRLPSSFQYGQADYMLETSKTLLVLCLWMDRTREQAGALSGLVTGQKAALRSPKEAALDPSGHAMRFLPYWRRRRTGRREDHSGSPVSSKKLSELGHNRRDVPGSLSISHTFGGAVLTILTKICRFNAHDGLAKSWIDK